MGRRVKSPALPPNLPFVDLDLDEQSRCLALNLQQARQRAGLNRDDLSQLVVPYLGRPLSVSFIGTLERGERNATVPTLLALAKALKIAPGALFARPREKPTPKVLRAAA